MAVDEKKMATLMDRLVADIGAVLHGPLVVLGERLGLYRALAKRPHLPAELARETATDERYVAEWLAANAAAGYVEYDPAAKRYRMTEEQAAALVDRDSPYYTQGAFLVAMAMFRDEPKVVEAFRSGKGIGWHQHDRVLFDGIERLARAAYAENLVPAWIPSLSGVRAKLEAGARVADVGCGHGVATILMARAFPRSRYYGFDHHADSVARARKAAEQAGMLGRIAFEMVPPKAFPGEDYDLIAFFDSLHNMGDPEAVVRHVLRRLAPDGTCLVVEPFAHDELKKNLNPVGRIFYSTSAMIAAPAAKTEEGGLVLGAQAGEARLRRLFTDAGFTRFRRAAQSRFHLVLEARR